MKWKQNKLKNRQCSQASCESPQSCVLPSVEIHFPALSDCYDETDSPITSRNTTVSQTNITIHETDSITTKMKPHIPSAMTSLKHLISSHNETQQQQKWQTEFMDCFIR